MRSVSALVKLTIAPIAIVRRPSANSNHGNPVFVALCWQYSAKAISAAFRNSSSLSFAMGISFQLLSDSVQICWFGVVIPDAYIPALWTPVSYRISSPLIGFKNALP
jgi:hypothetical protein